MPIDSAQSVSGLSPDEVIERRARFGENSLPNIRVESVARKMLQQFNNPLIYILLFALLVDTGIWFYEGANTLPLEAIAILLILLANASLGLWQNLKSEAAVAQLTRLTEPQSWVIRGGRLQHIESKLLVPGDIVRVEAGERIPADGGILEHSGFMLDESVVTGESAPIIVHSKQEVLSGTLAARGFALIEIVSTGANSNMGKLASLLIAVKRDQTPLEKRLDVIGNKIAIVVALAACLLWIAGILIAGTSHSGELLLFAVALAVAAVPESLPAVITLSLALGIERMARRKAVIRKMSAVEALGSVTVIATDKTGTLTENTMSVQKLDCTALDETYRAMILANDADLESGAGDPLDIGIMTYVDQQDAQLLKATQATYKKISVRPFDAEWKYMRVTTRNSAGEIVSYLKGAPEVLLGLSSLTQQEQESWHSRINDYAGKGYRAIALAMAAGESESKLQWLGVVLLLDPPRPEVADSIQEALNAGIRVLMLTGDHPATAHEIARQVGILSEQVMTGAELDLLSEDDFSRAIQRHNVFARVSPEHKLKIVRVLQEQGEVVAVTGDGVNDAPALKAADVGIAMGQRGSDVSREVADLVLIDDNFATIVAAIEEGRNIFENIQKFIRFLFATNFSEVLLISIGSLLAFVAVANGAEFILPLTAAQILWINLLTDSVPALAIAVDRNPGVLEFQPKQRNSPLLDGNSLRFIFFAGGVGSVVSLLCLLGLPALGVERELTQTVVFCYLTLVQLTFVNPARMSNLLPKPNVLVLAALSISFVAQVLVVTVPGLRVLLDLAPLTLELAGLVLLLLLVSWVLAHACSRILRTRQQQRRQSALPGV